MVYLVLELVGRESGLAVVKDSEEESPTVAELRRIRTEIWRIGHNINQIAHNTNRDMNATIEDEASATYAVEKCESLLGNSNAVLQNPRPSETI
jgi:hypothetical protein